MEQRSVGEKTWETGYWQPIRHGGMDSGRHGFSGRLPWKSIWKDQAGLPLPYLSAPGLMTSFLPRCQPPKRKEAWVSSLSDFPRLSTALA